MSCNCDKCKSKETNIQELPKIIGGFLNLTQKCNLKCKYCFVVQQPMEMPYAVAKDAADFYAKNAKELGENPSINYFGGEPLLKWDEIIVPLTKYIRETYGDNFTVSMTSNGILLDKEKLDFMKEHNIGLLFSIDGDKKTQDLNRPFHNGKGSFDLLKEKIPMILEYYPNMTFRSTVDHDNVNDMADNYQFAIDMGYTNVFMIPNVSVNWTHEEKEELKKQLSLIGNIYMEQIRKGKCVEFNQFSSGFRKIKNIEEAEKTDSFRNKADKFPGFGRCGIGATKFASIGVSGNIYSCQELVENPEYGDTFKIGNIYTGVEDSLRWDIISKFNIRNVISGSGKPCNSCVLNKVCEGSCLINNYLVTGDLNIMPEILCYFYQEIIGECLRIMKTMLDEKNDYFASIIFRK